MWSPPLPAEYTVLLDYPEIAELIDPELEIVDLPMIPAVCCDPADRSLTMTEQGDLFRVGNTHETRTGGLVATCIEVRTSLAVQSTELAAA